MHSTEVEYMKMSDASVITTISKCCTELNRRGFDVSDIRAAIPDVSLIHELREHERLRAEAGAPPRTHSIRDGSGHVDGHELVDRAKREAEAVRKREGRQYSDSDTRSKRAKLLNEALNLVVDARNDQYGSALHDFSKVAALLNTLGFRRYENTALQLRQLRAGDWPIIAICVKLSRLEHDPDHYDSLLDIAGYAACAAECRGLG